MKPITHFQMMLVTFSFGALVACQTAQIPGQTPAPSPSSAMPSPPASSSGSSAVSASTVFPNALSKRSLSPTSFSEGQNPSGSQSSPSSPEASNGNSTGGSGAAPAPMAPPMAGSDAAGGKRMAPGYFGSPFDQVELKFVEELRFAAPQGTTLLSTYQKDMLPLVNAWDSNARLLMSSASAGPEMYYLPNDEQEPEQAEVNFAFQWVSNAKRETLMIYVLDNEIRMHRMVWGAPHIDMSALTIDSADALERSKKAFADRSNAPGYPVYPESDNQDPNINVLYAIPENASWDVSLSEQQGKLRYYISVNFKVKDTSAKPQNSDVYVGGFIEMDALTGKIEQLNRPTWYAWNEGNVPSPIAMSVEEVR